MTNVAPREEEEEVVLPPLTTPAESGTIGRAQWLALTAALLGWMFDGAEMGIFSMVGRPALQDLIPQGSTERQIALWFGVVTAGFLVGAATGGVLFGWLGDRIGRVRAMTLSVLTYAIFTALCGFATAAWHIGVLRFVAALGMGGEWSLGVALVMEVWPNRSRAFMAGLIGAASNVGFLLVGLVGIGLDVVLADLAKLLAAVGFSEEHVGTLISHQGWRLIMMLGVLPALLTFFIRLFVPESRRWQNERARGATSHWQAKDLCGILIGAAGPGLIIYLWAAERTGEIEHTWQIRVLGSLIGLAIATLGYTYPVVRYLHRQAIATNSLVGRDTLRRMLLGAGLSGVALLGTWGSAQWADAWSLELANNPALHAAAYTQICGATGAILGTIGAALLCDRWGRRITYSVMCVAAMASLLMLYQGNKVFGNFFLFSSFIMGICTASFYGWLPLYLPELFRTNVRATGQGFGFNFGRLLAAVGALQTGNLFAKNVHVAGYTFQGGYPFACSAISLIYLVGLVLIWFGPETRGKLLPE